MKVYIVRPFENNTIGTKTNVFATADALLTWYGHEGIVSDEHGKEARIYNRAIIKVTKETITDDLLGTIAGEEKYYHVTETELHE